MRFWMLLTCAVLCIQQSSANAQYYYESCYYYVVPMYQPAYYPVESYSACNCCQSYAPAVSSQTCNACTTSSCPDGCQPVWETNTCGSKTLRHVPECKASTYTNASLQPEPIEVAFKGTNLTLSDPAQQAQIESLLISTRKAVTKTIDLRLGNHSCIEEGDVLDVDFIRVSDDIEGHVAVKVVDDSLELTAWIFPKDANPELDTQSKEEAKKVFLAVREQLATILGVPVPQDN